MRFIGKTLRFIAKLLKWIGLVVAGLLVLGGAYQLAGPALDAKLAPPADQMFAVNGRKVHVACAGEGPRTFVLDAGAGAWSYEWFRLKPILARTARVCTFDRPGLGWSDTAPIGRDGSAAADELAAIVAAAKIPRPFYYVGHSLGANFAQIYAAKYPADIAGLVLIEPGDPRDLLEDVTQPRAEVVRTPDCQVLCRLAGALGYLGVPRVLAPILIGHHTLPPRERADYVAGLARSPQTMTMAAELAAVPKTAFEDLDVKSFGSAPVLVFDSTLPRPPEGKETVADVKIWKTRQRAYLASLAAKSGRGAGPVDVPNSSHVSMVMGEPQAQFIAAQISAFVQHAQPAPS